MIINTDYLTSCIDNLTLSLELLAQQKKDDDLYKVYRAAVIKEFELILEQSGKLLKKRIQFYFSSKKSVDKLSFKDIFRSAAKFDLISIDEVVRWCEYRDNKNETAYDYGVDLAEKTLALLIQFIADSKKLVLVISDTIDK